MCKHVQSVTRIKDLHVNVGQNWVKYHARPPMNHVSIGISVPLSETQGNIVILMFIEYFTKWIGCFPLSSQSAELVSKTIVDEIFTLMKTPMEIHFDRYLLSDLFPMLCALLQITKTV